MKTSAWLLSGPALLVSFSAMSGSLYYSEIMFFYPCSLCIVQRFLMYPLNLILLVSLFEKNNKAYRYVLPFSVTGLLVATYHYFMQWGFISSEACYDMTCGSRYVNFFGFITIPFQSLIAFFLINALMIFQWRKQTG